MLRFHLRRHHFFRRFSLRHAAIYADMAFAAITLPLRYAMPPLDAIYYAILPPIMWCAAAASP